jgi:hypothetical protein
MIDHPLTHMDLRWWRMKDEPHGAVFGAVQRIDEDEDNRRDHILHYLRLYGNRNLVGLGPSDYALDGTILVRDADLKYNLCKSVVDTAVSRIGKNKPKATFLTNAGNFSLQTQARRLEKYVEGSFYETDIYAKGRAAFRDGAIIGTGLLKFFPRETTHGWKVWNERVFPWEVYVDRHDGRYGEPRQMYHLKYVDRRVLRETFPKDARGRAVTEDKLKSAANALDGSLTATQNWEGETIADEVLVVEAWHLPSGPGAKDGCHVICTDNCTLFKEEWNCDWFPIVAYHWTRPVVGFWGTGIIKDIQGIQVEINRLLDKLQRAYHLFANPWIAVHRSSRVVKSHITNEMGRILEYEGSVPPQVVTHNPISPQLFQHLDQLKRDGHDIPGISQMAAQNKKPADLESGAALREWNDIEDTRHADPALAYEAFYMQCAKVIIGMSRMMAEQNIEPQVMATYQRRSRKWVEVIKWSEVNIDEASYAMKIYPSSTLPSTPAGRTATVQEWMRAGLVTQEEARYLLDFPDLEAHQSFKLASFEVVLDAIEEMLDHGRFVAPEPFQNLQDTLQLVQMAYLRAKLDRVPEARLELMRRYLVATKRLLDISEGRVPATRGQALAPAMPAPGALGPTPLPGPAAPGAAPLPPGPEAAGPPAAPGVL